MTTHLVAPAAVHHVREVTVCASCRHSDWIQQSWLTRLSALVGRPRTCAYSIDEFASPLRNESCGCSDPLHAVGQPAKR